MSQDGCTVDGIEDAIRAYLAEHYSDTTVLTDWFVAYGAMRSTDESPTGLGYVTGYTCSDSSPQGTLGIAQLGVNHMSDDLAAGRDD